MDSLVGRRQILPADFRAGRGGHGPGTWGLSGACRPVARRAGGPWAGGAVLGGDVRTGPRAVDRQVRARGARTLDGHVAERRHHCRRCQSVPKASKRGDSPLRRGRQKLLRQRGPKQVTAQRRRYPRGMRINCESRHSGRSDLALVSALAIDPGLSSQLARPDHRIGPAVHGVRSHRATGRNRLRGPVNERDGPSFEQVGYGLARSSARRLRAGR
jgi:hypothetical protein